ncbi:MAG: GH116 family glycosyl hydrolase [Fimbriimonas sp.]
MAAFPLRTLSTPIRSIRGVPEDKGLDPAWVRSLTARGRRTVYSGKDLRTIGMPVGGIGAGQVNLGGDGRLWLWDIFNEIKLGVVSKTVRYQGADLNAMGGANYVESPEQVHPFQTGLSLRTKEGVRPLDHRGWSDIQFRGEYPVGTVEYRDPAAPVAVTLQAFSPFIPLNTDDSCLPATILRVTVKNTSSGSVEVDLAGYLENPVGNRTVEKGEAIQHNRFAQGRGFASLEASLAVVPRPEGSVRPDILFDDFERDTWGDWTATGTAFGTGPYERAKMAPYQGDVGGSLRSKRVVNTHNARNGEDLFQADGHTGRLTSKSFVISRNYIAFWVGGGNHAGKTCVNLIIGESVVRTTTGQNDNRMRRAHFDVTEFAGKTAHIELVDEVTGAWGNIGFDEVVFTDTTVTAVPVAERRDVGELVLAFLEGGDTWVSHGLTPTTAASECFSRASKTEVSAPSGTPLVSAMGRTFTLAPGVSKTVTAVYAWRFPNLVINQLGAVGYHYAVRFPNAVSVVEYIAANAKRLVGDTLAWRDTWYDSTLPFWFLDRTLGNACTMATMTCVRFGNGRFYGWEGIGCCDGTCGHVWQYAQSTGRLFPELERTVREMVDFGVAFRPDGLIEFRGEYGNGYAVDAQAGYVLRTLREHQTSADSAFLKRVWPKAKKALQYLINQDGKEAGVLVNRQHNTLDVDLYGPSSWLTSLYLAALRAGEEMAKEMGDGDFAAQCQRIFRTGTDQFVKRVWNGEYFIHRPDPNYPDALRYGNGCQVDQVMGQWWAFQVGLGRILDEGHTKKALAAVYKYNFLTDVGPFREKNKPGRWYATPGEAGLLICSFPKNDKAETLGNTPVWASMYFNECMTGFEYEVAGHMVAEGMVTEGMAVTRAVHDRYHASKRNPWNEVECSDHYARCMAAHGVFINACGFEYHGPKGHMGFAPRITPENFRAPFNAAEGWGTYAQKRVGSTQTHSLLVSWGSLRLKTLAFEVASTPKTLAVKLGSSVVPASFKVEGSRVLVSLGREVLLAKGQKLEVVLA